MSQTQEPIPSIVEIDRIAALDDPVLRNLQITQAYAGLSQAMLSRTGGRTTVSANWCTFATWASKQAGQSIRKEDLRRALERAVREALTPPQAQSQARDLSDPAQPAAAQQAAAQQAAIQHSMEFRLSVERVADAVGRGNRKVFAEIGRIFAAFLAECGADQEPDPAHLERFCDTLRPGDPPDGREYLRRAFRRYYQAFFEPDAKQRAELLLFANIEIGYHEQTRLQPEIAEALNAASINLFALARLLLASEAVFTPRTSAGRPLGLAFWLYRRRLRRRGEWNRALEAMATAVQAGMRHVFTECLMTIEIPPSQIIRLGEKLPTPYPELLRVIADPELGSFMARFDPGSGALEGEEVQDWADLPQRLGFIIHLFRCYQESPDLFTPPYLPEQIIAIESGCLPEGRL